MKKASLILNVILVIAVGFLYYLHFSKSENVEASPAIKISAKDVKPSTIVYIDSDSLLNNYDLYKKLKNQLEDKNKKSELELTSKAKQFEQEVQAYQQKAGSGALSREQMESAEMDLKRKQETLMGRKEELGNQLIKEEQKLNEQLYKNIEEYLKKYSKQTNYKFVLGYSKGGGILYANDSLDITGQIIEGLNKEYKEKNK